MTAERQKQMAKELLLAADRGETAKVAEMISDDFRLEFMHRLPLMLPTGEPLPAVYDREEYLGFVPTIPSLTKDGMHFTFELALAEGPYVALFGESKATAPSGKDYSNAYTWLFGFTGDRISLLREYSDTHLVRTALFG